MNNIIKTVSYMPVPVLYLIMWIFAGSNAVSAIPKDQKAPRVLYINSYHRGYSWSDGIEQGVRDRFRESGRAVDLYIEYLDTQRFPDTSQFPLLAELLAMKHRKISYDVIIVSDNNAFNFAVKYRSRIFPDTPLVFCGYNSFRPEIIRDIRSVTGVNEESDYTGTIDLALSVQPETDTLVLITSDHYSSGKINQDRVESDIIPAYRDRYRIVQLKNLYMKDIEEQLALLPHGYLVFVFGNSLDNLDRVFIPAPEYYRRLAAASSVAVYSFWDFTINTGIMGGKIITGSEQGRTASELALKIIDGIPAAGIPVVMQTPTNIIFDYNAMKRFGIPEKSLPKGSRIINRPDTFYHKYMTYVWIALSVFTLLSSLVVVLAMLLQRSRILGSKLLTESGERQKAMIELQQHKEHLEEIVTERTVELRRAFDALQEREALFHSMFDSHSAAMYLMNPDDGRIIDANQAALQYYGYAHDRMQSMNIYEINQQGRDELEAQMKLAKAEKQKFFEFRHRLANGDIRDVEVHTTPIAYKGEEILFSIVHDITDRKRGDYERESLIHELQDALSRVKTLSGMLPICASCKKIRNDKGYWEQIEIYIGEHSRAEFSHGLCPDCAEKLYPNLKRK